MKRLWMRLGVSFEISEEEEESIFNSDHDLAAKTLRKIVEERRFRLDGDSYIPEDTVDYFNEMYGTDYEVKEIGFEA